MASAATRALPISLAVREGSNLGQGLAGGAAAGDQHRDLLARKPRLASVARTIVGKGTK